MISPALMREILALLSSINNTFYQSIGHDLVWEDRNNNRGILTQQVSELMTEEQATLIKNHLALFLPTAASVVKSRNVEGVSSYRVKIDLDRCERDLKLSTYINSFLSNIRLFPHIQWLNTGDGYIQATYPIKHQKYYSLLCQALVEFNSGLNFDCFNFSTTTEGELLVVGNIKDIEAVITHHKMQCLHILQKYLIDVKGISQITMYADVTGFNSHYTGLIINNIEDGGLPGITFQVANTSSYQQALACFPKLLEMKSNGYVSTDYDENIGREIGVRVSCIYDIPYLVTRNLYHKLHEARSDFCQQLWIMKTKGSITESNLRFFPREIPPLIYKDICPKQAYLTHEEIMETIQKIEHDTRFTETSMIKV